MNEVMTMYPFGDGPVLASLRLIGFGLVAANAAIALAYFLLN